MQIERVLFPGIPDAMEVGERWQQPHHSVDPRGGGALGIANLSPGGNQYIYIYIAVIMQHAPNHATISTLNKSAALAAVRSTAAKPPQQLNTDDQ